MADTAAAVAVAEVAEATMMVLLMSFDFGKMAEELNEHEFTVRMNLKKIQSIILLTTKAHYLNFGMF